MWRGSAGHGGSDRAIKNKRKRIKKIYIWFLPSLPIILDLQEWPLILQHVWYAEPPARAACCSDPGKQSPSAPLSGGLLGKHFKPEFGGERQARSKCAGMEKITKCSQPHRKHDGPECCMIKVKWILYLQHSVRTAVIQRHTTTERSINLSNVGSKKRNVFFTLFQLRTELVDLFVQLKIAWQSYWPVFCFFYTEKKHVTRSYLL